MAILDSTETLDTTSSSAEDGRRATLRRRPSARSAEPMLDSDSNSMEAESVVNDVGSDRNDANLRGNLSGEVVESENEERGAESASEGLSYGKEKENEKEENVKENGESNSSKALDISSVKFAYRPSAPAHRRIKESPLSSDAIFKQSHAGLFNLCIVVLVAVNGRLIIENVMKYGWLIRSGFWFGPKSIRDWPLLMCCLSLPIFPLFAFLVEKLVKQKSIPEWAAVLLHVIITTTALLYPVIVILRCDSAVLSGVTLMLFACIVWLKLVSYAHTNYDLRELEKSLDKREELSSYWNMDYSYDVSFKSLAYFMVAPTLCYQPSYPRTASIRKGWVVRQLIKLVIFTGLMGFIIEQYINPIVQNSQHPLNGNLLYAIERVLKLSVPNLYVWLCMFYCFFHLWLNILAELLCFGDREFYKDWWNARTVEEYWRMWNMPVHKWMVRHIYFPCLRNGIPKGVAVLVAFLVSAIFHELCIAVPCQIFKFWAFIGIMFQVRSLTLDVKVWEPSVITLFQALGNVFVNSIWEGLLRASITVQADELPIRSFESDKYKQFFSKPHYSDHITVKEKFIQAKYIEKRFVYKPTDSQHLLSVAEQLWESVRMNDRKQVYRLIVTWEADVNAIRGRAKPTSFTLANVMRLHDRADSDDITSQSLAGNESTVVDELFDGCSLLHVSCQTADIGMVELLLQHGADINACDSKGQTPLHHCIMRGRCGIAKLLLMRGADSEAVDNEGRTPSELLMESAIEDVELLALLKSTER